jgi:RsiW-degrading membrane proteinase PrsW (M82 family)
MGTALMLSLIAAIVPTILYVLLFYWADRYEREPLSLVAAAFVWGAVPAIIVSLILEIVIGRPFIEPLPETRFFGLVLDTELAGSLMEGAVVAPIVEELVKGLALVWLFSRRGTEFDGVLDGLLYGSLVGLGFSMTENFFYFIGAFDEGGFGNLIIVIILRTIFGLNHALYTGLIGIGLGLTRNASTAVARYGWPVAGLVAAIVAHSLHNLGAGLAAVNPITFLISLLVAVTSVALPFIVMVLAWRHERAVIAQELAEEVGTVLSHEELGAMTGKWHRPRNVRRDRSREALLTQLALRKYRLRQSGEKREPGLPAEIARLRGLLVPVVPRA